MKRERTLQIVVGLLGVAYIAMIYPLYTDLWHANWLLVTKNETEPMFLSFFIALGFFLGMRHATDPDRVKGGLSHAADRGRDFDFRRYEHLIFGVFG